MARVLAHCEGRNKLRWMSNTNEKWGGKSCHATGGPACHLRIMYWCGGSSRNQPQAVTVQTYSNATTPGHKGYGLRIEFCFLCLLTGGGPESRSPTGQAFSWNIMWLFMAASE